MSGRMVPVGFSTEATTVSDAEAYATKEGDVFVAIAIDPDRPPIMYALDPGVAISFLADLVSSVERVTERELGDLLSVEGGRWVPPIEEAP